MAHKMNEGIFLTAEDVENLSYPIFTALADFEDRKTVAKYRNDEVHALKSLNDLLGNL